MILECKRPMLIVEGAGDIRAIPRLIRETFHANSIYDVSPAPHPKANVEIRKLMRAGELERYVEYASRDEGDSVLVILDCEDFCPIVVCREFCMRIRAMNPNKKVGVALFRSEFETLFLYCLDEIVAHFRDYGWRPNRLPLTGDIEAIRNAKGTISRMMRERSYKETRDQEKFVTALDFVKLRQLSRSFKHFENTLLWLAKGFEPIYPLIDESTDR
jgi:hypothetical protein